MGRESELRLEKTPGTFSGSICAPIVGCIVVLAVPVIDSRANIVLLPIAVRSGRGLCEYSRLRSHTDLT